MRYGQALVELAIALPVLVLLALGGVTLAQASEARSGLDAATSSALAEAARSADPARAQEAALTRFAAVISAYPVDQATLTIELGDFSRGSIITAAASGRTSLVFAAVPGLPGQLRLSATARAVVEPWRSRAGPLPTPLPTGLPGGCGVVRCRLAGP